jgi:hypothetical protein
VEAARKIRQRQFVPDGESVILGVDGVTDFDALHSREIVYWRGPFEHLLRSACHD